MSALLTLIMSHVTEAPSPMPTPCWLTDYFVNKDGYVTMKIGGGRRRSVHRVTYELLVGPIPDGLQLDHLCRVRGCVNPAHLEPVTPRENTLRGVGPNATAVRTNRCKYGHSLADAYTKASGSRGCRTCSKIRAAKSRQSRVAA